MNLSPIITLRSLGLTLIALGFSSCANVDSPSARNAGAIQTYSESLSKAKPKSSPADSSYLNRPGLGTQAGEKAYSSVENTAFYRKLTGAPDAVDSFHYNDDEGARAMLGGETASIQKHGGAFSEAGDLLKVSLVSDRWSGGDAFPWLSSKRVPDAKIVVGDKGSDYSIHLENKSKHRLEVVTSVDGLDVMDGKPASVKKNGYVLAAGQEMNISGFRENSDYVRQFQFGSVRDSSAAKKGGAAGARNVGVIGLAVWLEDKQAALQATQREASQRTLANPFGGSPVSIR